MNRRNDIVVNCRVISYENSTSSDLDKLLGDGWIIKFANPLPTRIEYILEKSVD